jgi:hypothetical protein
MESKGNWNLEKNDINAAGKNGMNSGILEQMESRWIQVEDEIEGNGIQ